MQSMKVLNTQIIILVLERKTGHGRLMGHEDLFSPMNPPHVDSQHPCPKSVEN